MGIIIAAMVNPPVNFIWYAFFNFIGIALVFDSIITSSWNYAKVKKKLAEANLSQAVHNS